MRMSEVTITELKNYAHVYHDVDDNLFTAILIAAKSYIQSYTGLSSESMDMKEELTIALFVLSTEMYENRMYTVERSSVNQVVQSILNMHSINLL
jgi:uncharacterized phage protein (predicted DNA packaging)